MTPLNVREADDLLRHRRREIEVCRRQVGHFARLQQSESCRLTRLQAELAALASTRAQLAAAEADAQPAEA